MAKTVAELSGYVDLLNKLLDVTRQEVAQLRTANGTLTEQLQQTREDVIRQREVSAHLQRQLDDSRETASNQDRAITDLRQELAATRQENAVLGQQLQDHVAQYQESDRRRWGLFVLLVGAVMSLASGLIVTLAKK